MKARDTDSLAFSPYMRAVSRYLTWSVRAGAYAANLYFLSLIDSYVDTYISFPILRNLIYFVYGILLYEIAVRIISARYKPSFSCESEIPERKSHRLVLNETDYMYRVMAEKLIYQSALYYGFSLVIAVTLVIFIPVKEAWQPIGLGLLGGFLSVFNFLGVVILASSGSSFSHKTLPMYFMACGYIAPLLIYIVFTFRGVFTG
jgi:hypothetical protein